jgi:exosome complex RNA-binding protein Csl4
MSSQGVFSSSRGKNKKKEKATRVKHVSQSRAVVSIEAVERNPAHNSADTAGVDLPSGSGSGSSLARVLLEPAGLLGARGRARVA